MTRSVGWKAENGNTYCIAPIVPLSKTATQKIVEFWAVGVNCCSSVGSFTCDDSERLDVHAGAVVFDNNSWFQNSNFDFYTRARLKAMGEFGLSTTADSKKLDIIPEPAYIRWFEDTSMVEETYAKNAYALWGISSVVVLPLSFLLSSLVTKMIGGVAMRVRG